MTTTENVTIETTDFTIEPAKIIHVWFDGEGLIWSNEEIYPLGEFNYSPDFGIVVTANSSSYQVLQAIRETLKYNCRLKQEYQEFLNIAEL
jgi:hypothetical protein